MRKQKGIEDVIKDIEDVIKMVCYFRSFLIKYVRSNYVSKN